MEELVKKFRVDNGKDFRLKDHDPGYCGGYDKEKASLLLEGYIAESAKLQQALYADNRYAVLILFQAMDAAGKDSGIAHTMSGLNPQGCDVVSFKQPSAEELSHDFLWRHYKALPRFGRIGVHNRSHYENVLVARVHPELLMQEKLPGINKPADADDEFWHRRYESIRNFEKHLYTNSTVLIKIFLNVSKEEQRLRFLKRIDEPEKNWKFSAADVYERQFWDDYMMAYETAVQQTATKECPWYVLPADKKWFTRLAISAIILHKLKSLNLTYPVLPDNEKKELEKARKALLK